LGAVLVPEWYKNGITIYPITEKRVELFYWIAILFSNSHGTAFGDYLIDNVCLSYLVGALVAVLNDKMDVLPLKKVLDQVGATSILLIIPDWKPLGIMFSGIIEFITQLQYN